MWEPKDVASLIVSGVSTAVAILALIVAHRAQRANYRLAKEIAERAGRLASILIRTGGTSSADFTIDLVAINGPNEVTITNVGLEVTHRPTGTTWRGGQGFRFWVAHDEFGLFGITGPEPGFRFAAHEQVVWRMPRHDYHLAQGEGIEFRALVATASGGIVKSEPYKCGKCLPSLRPGSCNTYHGSLIGMIQGAHSYSDSINGWLSRVLNVDDLKRFSISEGQK